MSFFFEILERIRCRFYNHTINQSDSTSNYEQDRGSSSPVTSTRTLPSNTSVQNRTVIGSRRSYSASTERINQVSTISSPTSSGLTDKKNKMKYELCENDPLPIYIIPKDIKDLIEKVIVPGVLYKPLSPSTYKDYFAALLYAEDYYIEVHQMIILYNGFMDSYLPLRD